jgi:hypothetical protein
MLFKPYQRWIVWPSEVGRTFRMQSCLVDMLNSSFLGNGFIFVSRICKERDSHLMKKFKQFSIGWVFSMTQRTWVRMMKEVRQTKERLRLTKSPFRVRRCVRPLIPYAFRAKEGAQLRSIRRFFSMIKRIISIHSYQETSIQHVDGFSSNGSLPRHC